MTSVAEARVLECAQAIAANVVAIRKLSGEIRAARCLNETEYEPETGTQGLPPCVFLKVKLPASGAPDDEPIEVLPWYHFDGVRDRGREFLSAEEIGKRYDYCPECVLQVDRFRARKVLKAKKGGLVSALVRVVGIMHRKEAQKA